MQSGGGAAFMGSAFVLRECVCVDKRVCVSTFVFVWCQRLNTTSHTHRLQCMIYGCITDTTVHRVGLDPHGYRLKGAVLVKGKNDNYVLKKTCCLAGVNTQLLCCFSFLQTSFSPKNFFFLSAQLHTLDGQLEKCAEHSADSVMDYERGLSLWRPPGVGLSSFRKCYYSQQRWEIPHQQC